MTLTVTSAVSRTVIAQPVAPAPRLPSVPTVESTEIPAGSKQAPDAGSNQVTRGATGRVPVVRAGAEGPLPFSEQVDPRTLPARAVIETTKGPVGIVLYADVAPISVKNFVYLSQKGFYNGVAFHALTPGYAIQGGDPSGTGKGGPGYSLPAEISALKFERGTIGWARFSVDVNPERRSSGSQFFICLRRAKHLNGLYTIFAKVAWGMENVDDLVVGDKIVKIYFPGYDTPLSGTGAVAVPSR